MNTTHVEHDALAALRAELTMAAGRRIRRRRARRRTVLIAALIALLAVATAATAALVTNTTGVPAVDKLLDVEHHPGGGSVSASRRLIVPEGDHRTNVVAYLTDKGSVCVSSANFGGRGGSARGGFGGCPPLEDVNRRIERRGAVWFASAHGLDQRTYQLIVGGDVESVRPPAKGEWRFKMTPPWTPRARDPRPLRLVVAIDEQDLPEQGLGRLPVGFPKLELRYRNGKTRVARFP